MNEYKIYDKYKETFTSDLNIHKDELPLQELFETALCFMVSSVNYEMCRHTQSTSRDLYADKFLTVGHATWKVIAVTELYLYFILFIYQVLISIF